MAVIALFLTFLLLSFINPAVTTAETGRDAEAAGGAGPPGGAGSTADRSDPTENTSRRTEG